MADDGDNIIPFPRRRVVDYISYLIDYADRGKPLSTAENIVEICRRLGVTIRYNVITKNEEILIPDVGFSMDNRENASLAWIVSECAKFRMPIGSITEFVSVIAEANQYNPVATWIESSPWDGQDRLTDLLHTIVAKGERENPGIVAQKRTFLTRWMVSAIAAAYRPNGVSAHGVLVFQGAEYVGKTHWFRRLAPESLGVLKDGLLLRPDDRDSVMHCISNWIVELGELDATFRKADIASLKSFLTMDRDVLRRPYARKDSTYPRRTVFFASVNPKNFLHDQSGNRRYWTIEVEALDHGHEIDMQQCWAQVLSLYRDGTSWYLSPDEFIGLNAHNLDFQSGDPIEDIIGSSLDWAAAQGFWTWRTATEVLMAAGLRNPSKSDVTRAAVLIRKQNGDQAKRIHGGVRVLLVPPASIR